MRVVIGADHVGLDLKNAIRDQLIHDGYDVTDLGVNETTPVDYPDVALAVALAVVSGDHDRGILVCGTGIGMAIAANKVAGIRAALIYDPHSAERAAKSNDANIATLGSRTLGVETAKMLVGSFLRSDFAGGDSARKVAKIKLMEERFGGGPGAHKTDAAKRRRMETGVRA
jgi:ribose 5-phosphate isomerase B